jgi:hypothetical protein
MNDKKLLKIKTIGKIGREISYFLPAIAGFYLVINFITWASKYVCRTQTKGDQKEVGYGNE